MDLWSQKNKMCPTIPVTFITNTHTHINIHEHEHQWLNMVLFTNQYLLILKAYVSTELRSRSTTSQKERGLYFSIMKLIKIPGHKIQFCFTMCLLDLANSSCITWLQCTRVLCFFRYVLEWKLLL